MPKLYAVPAVDESVTPAGKTRKRLREKRKPPVPQCATCTGREYIFARIGTTKTKICVGCLSMGRRREMS